MSQSILAGSSTTTTTAPATNSTQLGNYYGSQISNAASSSFWNLNTIFSTQNKWFWVIVLAIAVILLLVYVRGRKL